MFENNRVSKINATAWMVRRDGRTFPCRVHYYGSLEDVEETLYAAEWMFLKTQNNSTRQAILDLVSLYGKSLSIHRSSVRNLIRAIHTKPYQFLSEAFVREHMQELLLYRSGTVEELNEKVCFLLNNEFMRVRYGGMYDTEEGCKDIYFRISSNDYDWSDCIKRVIRHHGKKIETFTVVKDFESTGDSNFYKICDINIDKLPRLMYRNLNEIK